MIEYLPWSSETHLNCLKKYSEGKFSCLDIELGGECNYHCVYCDSPDRKKTCRLSLRGLSNLMATGMFEWVYICGLGEPTHHKNYDLLLEILAYCKKYHVKCSIFSNVSLLTNELNNYIREGILHIFFKYDSRDALRNQALYGCKKGDLQLDNIKELKKLVHVSDGKTNLAASIVPTRLNREYILPLVEECLDGGIFPLLGELESSGKGEMNYENLYLTESELYDLKLGIDQLIGEAYAIPSCPSVISGIHFSYDGKITVDKFSGLSCHWFWLKEPEVVELMPFTEKSDLDVMTNEILAYRDGCMEQVKEFLRQKKRIGGAFGGCGGEVIQLFSKYVEFHRRKEDGIPGQ